MEQSPTLDPWVEHLFDAAYSGLDPRRKQGTKGDASRRKVAKGVIERLFVNDFQTGMFLTKFFPVSLKNNVTQGLIGVAHWAFHGSFPLGLRLVVEFSPRDSLKYEGRQIAVKWVDDHAAPSQFQAPLQFTEKIAWPGQMVKTVDRKEQTDRGVRQVHILRVEPAVQSEARLDIGGNNVGVIVLKEAWSAANFNAVASDALKEIPIDAIAGIVKFFEYIED